MDFDTVKPFLLNEIEAMGLEYHGNNQYVCPFCGSGTGKNKSGAFTYYKDTKSFHCFVCGESGDITDFYSKYNQIDKNEALKILQEKYLGAKPVKTTHTTNKRNVEEICLEATKRKVESNYFKNRGFSQETVQEHGLFCYIDDHNDTRAFIPVSRNFIMTRRIQDKNDKFDKMKHGKQEIFNKKDLYDNKSEYVFVCEGWADCLSFYELGFSAISLNSVSNANQLIKQLEEKPTQKKIILALDSDEEGKKATEKLKKELSALGYEPAFFNLDGYHDVNDFFLADKKAFLENAYSCQSEKENYDNNYFSNQIDELLDGVKKGKLKPLPTGIPAVDYVLSGGFCPGLSVLAAESQMGKSTLAMNIAENLALKDNEVMYFSLEMSKTQLLLRGISRMSYLSSKGKRAFSSGEIKEKLHYGGNKEDLNCIENAISDYRPIAQNLIIYDNQNGLMTVNNICELVEKHIKEKNNVPIIIVDYLQYIYDDSPARQMEIQQIDHSVMKLKALSIKYNAIIIVLSSVNRKSYGDMIDMDSLKGSGKIEFTAEYTLGLSLSKSQNKTLSKSDVDKELKESPRKMVLQVLKGRDIENRRTAELDYYSKYNHFEGLKEDIEKVKPRFID